ncbi:MAG: DUF4276 family protein [Aggregatilineales bacterium]
MRLVIICEGDTEEQVLKKFLEPFSLPEPEGFGNNIELINTKGVGKLKNQFKKLAELELQNTDTYVLCLLDLYGAPYTYSNDVHQSDDPTHAKYMACKSIMESVIHAEFNERFFAFPVVHELETWILADIVSVKSYFQVSELTRYPAPESIENPAQELKTLLSRHRNREYKKWRDGRNLFDLIDANRVYDDNCPHFIALIDQLLALQGQEKDLEKIIPPLPQKVQLQMKLQAVRDKLGAVKTDDELNRLIDEETEIIQQIENSD